MFKESDLSGDKCERRRVVKDFCFPEGLEVHLIKDAGVKFEDINHQSHRMQQILYQSDSLYEQFYEQSFVFTMNANEDPKNSFGTDFDASNNQADLMDTFPSSGRYDRYFNCLCIIFNELVSSESKGRFLNADMVKRSNLFTDSKIYSTKKAYCIMFSNSYYQLQQDVLSAILKSLKMERLRLS